MTGQPTGAPTGEPTGVPTGRSADGYAYLLPNRWVHLDVDPARRAASVRRAVRRRVRREPRLGPYLAQLDRLLLSECTLAAARGAQRVSLLAEPVDGHPVTASVTLVVDSLSEGAPPLDARGVFERLVPEQVRALEGDPLATMEIVGLSQQEAVRRIWTAPVRASSDGSSHGAADGPAHGSVRSKHWQLVAPWPGRPRVAVLTLASPCVALWPQFAQTFDACTRTFHWTWSSGGGGLGSD